MTIGATPLSMNLSTILPALQQVTVALQSLFTTLQSQIAGGTPAAGAAALGGGPVAGAADSKGCSCGGASDAVAGASGIGDAPPPSAKTGGGAAAAPAPPKAPDDVKQDKKADAPKKAAPAKNANSSKGQQLADFAKKQLGKPYVYGGAGPDTFDCSGLTSFAAKHFGITIPRTASEQAKAGKAVDKKDLQAGDLVYFQNPGESSIGHIGMYVGDGKYVHAPKPGDNVKIGSLTDSYASKTYRGARRVV